MLERLSLEKAMRLTHEQPITVIHRLRTDIRQYDLLRYEGYSQKRGCHLFQVRTATGALRVLTDVELGLRGDVATARFAAPECPSGAAVLNLRISSANA